eukprot:m.125202 g.125202  ORF g.125202 m.125202 type:complete len:1071 (-) comp19772_c0_seq1:251-3463(-)
MSSSDQRRLSVLSADQECGSSSESEGEAEHSELQRRRSMSTHTTNLQRQLDQSSKSGSLLKHCKGIQGWKKRWFAICGNMLYYGKSSESGLYVRITLCDSGVAEKSGKNMSNTFELITAEKTLILQAEDRPSMQAWMAAFKKASNSKNILPMDCEHHWYFASAGSAVFCNVCKQSCGARSLICEVCKFRAHKRCAAQSKSDCKWRYRHNVPPEAILPQGMAHQWMQGNLPSGSRCVVCVKSCGSSKSLKHYRCLWCREAVHEVCRIAVPSVCSFGKHRASILPPTAIEQDRSTDPPTFKLHPPPDCSPLLVLINPKSGSNDGVRMMRAFNYLLNPAQVFDVTQGSPRIGLAVFRPLGSFRALGCGGDGTIGWILQEADKLGISKCQLGLLPLGTGNDLARVLGWGGAFSDNEAGLSHFIDQVESAKVILLDRWSLTMTDTAHFQSDEVAMPADEDQDAGGPTAQHSSKEARLSAELCSCFSSLLLSINSGVRDLLHVVETIRESSLALVAEVGSHDTTREATVEEMCASLRNEIESLRSYDTNSVMKKYEVVRGMLGVLSSCLQEILPEGARTLLCSTLVHPPNLKEISVMNNYFGIGLDAKVALDFDILRKEHPEKCRSRIKNQMWYGLLGSKEVFANSCKNLQRRVELYCDSKRIELPKSQGIVVLNISSYMGGTNFWGTKQEDRFRPQEMDDGILEVVTVKGSTQMAAVKAIPGIQPTRIAQAKEVVIVIRGVEPIPIQVDGEAWNQEPGVVRIALKNRAQLLSRDKAFQKMLTSWSKETKDAEASAAAAAGPQPSVNALSQLGIETGELVAAMRVHMNKDPASAATLQAAIDNVAVFHNRLFDPAGDDEFLPTDAIEYLDAVKSMLKTLSENQSTPTNIKEQAAQCDRAVSEAQLHTAGYRDRRKSAVSRMLRRISHTLVPDNTPRASRWTRSNFQAPIMDVQSELAEVADVFQSPHPTTAPAAPSTSAPAVVSTTMPAAAAALPLPASLEQLLEAPCDQWTNDDVLEWLESTGLGEFGPAFAANNICGADLRELSKAQLQKLGMVEEGSLRAFEAALSEACQSTA